MAVFALVVTSALGLALCAVGSGELAVSDSYADMTNAFMAAESGLQIATKALVDLEIPADTDADSVMDDLATSLASRFASGVQRNSDGDIVVPACTLACGQFELRISQVTSADGTLGCRVWAVGTKDGTSRTLSLDFAVANRMPGIFDYGVAAKGSIMVKGSAQIVGLPGSTGGPDIFSACAAGTPMTVKSSAVIAGDLAIMGSSPFDVDLNGNASVGGTTDPDLIRSDHIATNVEEPQWPKYDIEQFRDMTTTVVNSGTNLNGSNIVLENVLIKAGTNPQFKNNTVLNGIVFVEYPNDVNFKSDVTVNGLIVADPGPTDALAGTIEFKSGASLPGVDALPDTDTWAQIKEHTGTAILAPGSAVRFKAQATGINGAIVGAEVDFKASSEVSGPHAGPILSLSESFEMEFKAGALISLAEEPSDDLPAGFVSERCIEACFESYTEHVQP
jgi:hypothetical protein